MNFTKESLDIVEKISNEMEGNTFHHHYHILYDLGREFNSQPINYVEIGCYAGGSACLMLQRPNTNVVSIDLGSPISPDIVKRNVHKFNKLNNSYIYLQGNSQTLEMVNRLTNVVDSIDILFIDAEGFDSKIIKSIDFDNFNVSKIYYENMHIDVVDMSNFLENLGYKVSNGTSYTPHNSIATKTN
jgi:hypothetical protein